MSDRILVPVDGSDQARKALETATDWFGDEELIVFHVLNESSLNYANSIVGVHDHSIDEQIDQTVEAQARDLVDRALELVHERGVEATGETGQGKPARTIIEYAEETDVDRIVMGSHGHADITDRWFGSVADRVVKDAPVTVVIVR